MWFLLEMCVRFQSVVPFGNVRSFSMKSTCENGVKGFVRFFFIFPKNTIVNKSQLILQKSVQSLKIASDEVVKTMKYIKL